MIYDPNDPASDLADAAARRNAAEQARLNVARYDDGVGRHVRGDRIVDQCVREALAACRRA